MESTSKNSNNFFIIEKFIIILFLKISFHHAQILYYMRHLCQKTNKINDKNYKNSEILQLIFTNHFMRT